MAFDNNIVEEIKSRCNIVDVIGKVVPLKKAGSNYKGLCPFHNEKTPSFVVSESKQIFTCFGCGVSGNVIEFVKRYYNLDFLETIEKLAKEYNIEFKKTGYNSKEKEKLFEINREAAKFFYRAFREKRNPGYEYMAGRGVSQEVLKGFGIGYADGEWDSLYKHLTSLGYDKDSLLKLGLISVSNKNNQSYYDKFRNRVMFPIFNTRNKIIGFGGRIVGDGEPKYLNSPESIVFQKKNNLYGLNMARKEIGKKDEAILVEGYMDVVSLYQAGIQNVSASLGTALTENQAKMLKRYTKNIILSYDSDSAGRNAALRGSEILHNEQCRVRVLHVDDGKDPDEYVKKKGKEAFYRLVKNSTPYADYVLEDLSRKHDIENMEERVLYVHDAVQLLKKLSPAEADIYIKKISQNTGISEGAILREYRDEENKNPGETVIRPVPEEGEPENKELKSEISIIEKTLIKILFTDDSYWDIISAFDYAFDSIPGSVIYKTMKELYSEEGKLDPNKLFDSLEEDELNVLNSIIADVKLGGKEDDILYECIQTLEIRDLQRQRNELISIISLAEESDSKDHIKELMNKELRLQKRIQMLKEKGVN